MARLETEFKKWFRRNWSGWIESYEPRRGSGVGIPDIQIAVSGRIVPIELKVGTLDDDDVLWIDEVRPDQIGWHKRAAEAGIYTQFLVGVYEEGVLDAVVFVDQLEIKDWKKGIKDHFVIANFRSRLDHFHQECKHWIRSGLGV